MGLTELQYGMSGINVHFFFPTRPEEIKVCCGQRRESYRSLQSRAKKKEVISLAVADGCGASGF
jgi:hypothetical protein